MDSICSSSLSLFTIGHRSPPPHVRQPRPSASRDAHINDVSEPLPQRRSTSTTRPNSRFDQPASAFLKSSTRTEPYMTGADRLIGRDRNDRRESDTSRDYNSQSHMSSNHDVRQSLLDDDSPPASVLGPSRSPSPSSGGLMTDQSRTCFRTFNIFIAPIFASLLSLVCSYIYRHQANPPPTSGCAVHAGG